MSNAPTRYSNQGTGYFLYNPSMGFYNVVSGKWLTSHRNATVFRDMTNAIDANASMVSQWEPTVLPMTLDLDFWEGRFSD